MQRDDLRFLPRSFKMIEDPHTYYHKLRKEAPIYWSEDSNCWVLTRFEDVNNMLKDPRFGRGTTYRIVAEDDESMNDVEALRFNLLPFKDGDAHQKIRSAMNTLFHKRIMKLQPKIQSLANTLLDKVEHQKSFDLIADYAYPLSVGVISYLLGIPPTDKDIFKQYSPHFSALLVPKKTPKDIALAQTLIMELKDYFNTLIESNKKIKNENLISDMLYENMNTDALSDAEILVMPIFLIFAGHETTMNLIGNGMLELFEQPEQLSKLINEPEHIHTAIEELLRLTSTNSALYRIALEDAHIGDTQIKKGEEVVAILAAANRDPERFPNPDKIDITRKNGANISFGAGIHHCMGATLARIEGKIGYETLLKRIPDISLAEKPEWKESFVFRGLKSLIVNT